MNDYRKQAVDFLEKIGATVEIKFLHKGKHFPDDKEERNIYDVTIRRDNKEFSFKFGDSVANTKEIENLKRRARYEGRYMSGAERAKMQKYQPSEYDVLACLTKHDVPSDVWEFASEFGYTIESKADYRKVDNILGSVENEYENVMRLFGDVIEELREIQ